MHPLQPTYDFTHTEGHPPGTRVGHTAAQLQYALALLKSGQSVVFLVNGRSETTYVLHLAISIALRDYSVPSVTDEATEADSLASAAQAGIEADRGLRNLRFTDEPHHRLFFMSISDKVAMRSSNAVLIADHGIEWPVERNAASVIEEWRATLCDPRYDPKRRVPELLPPSFEGF